MKKFLVGLISVLVVGALSAAPAESAKFLDKAGGTPLRSVTSGPLPNQPDALEFVNNGPVELTSKSVPLGVSCSEMEFGTTVVDNGKLVRRQLVSKLALPFGVVENCVVLENGVPIPNSSAPTYFDTLPDGAVGVAPNEATITVMGAGATITNNLKTSVNIFGTFCTANLSGIPGVMANPAPGLMPEEMAPNLNLSFNHATVPVTCTNGSSFSDELTANFFVETMSTTTDTAFIEP